MGIALANQFKREGADVILVAGPIDLKGIDKGIEIVHVVSADEMEQACKNHFKDSDIGIMNAAVSDFRPVVQADKKIKRSAEEMTISLTPNADIAAGLGSSKMEHQLLVGFALETDEGLEAAIEKKERKNLDMIILNSLQDSGAGFGVDTNRVTIISKDNNPHKFELKTKKEVAVDIVDAIFTIFDS